MANLKKQRVIVVSLFCLLISIMAMPIVLLEYSNGRLMDNPTMDVLPWEPVTDENQTAQKDYDTLTRIQTTKKSSIEKTSVIVDWSAETMSEEQERELVIEVENQLSILQDFKALPQMSFSEENHVVSAKKAYMNLQDPSNPIIIRRIYLYYTDLFVSVYMDMETTALYEVSIFSKTQSLDYAKDELSAKGFLKYLQADSDSTEIEGESFDTVGDYTSSFVKIFVISWNNATQDVTYYGFENDSDYVKVDAPDNSIYYQYEAENAIKP